MHDITATARPAGSEIRAIRREAFRIWRVPDEALLDFIRHETGHVYLNPPGQAVYWYQCDYLLQFCARWFGKTIPEIRLLDWGAGKGQVAYMLRALGAKAVSCDVRAHPDSSFAKRRPILEKAGIEVVPVDDPVRLPFADASFDAVAGFGVLEHVQDDQGSLMEIRRILAPGGLFFCFNLPASGSWTQALTPLMPDLPVVHDRLYSVRSVRRLVAKADLGVVDIWRRQLFPKNRIRYSRPDRMERLDQFLVDHTPLRFLSTHIEFVAEAVHGR